MEYDYTYTPETSMQETNERIPSETLHLHTHSFLALCWNVHQPTAAIGCFSVFTDFRNNLTVGQILWIDGLVYIEEMLYHQQYPYSGEKRFFSHIFPWEFPTYTQCISLISTSTVLSTLLRLPRQPLCLSLNSILHIFFFYFTPLSFINAAHMCMGIELSTEA